MKLRKNIWKEAVVFMTVTLMVLSTITVINAEKAESNISFNDPVIELRFYQMDFNFDDKIYENTDWGSVELFYVGQEPFLYFNLAVNGAWQIQNIPVLSGRGVDVDQVMTYYFDLGNEVGEVVTEITYGYALTEDILLSMPPETHTAIAADDYIVMSSGFGGEMPDLTEAQPLVGGKISSTKKHAHKDFPNQECGEKECAPAAVSNSLKFLNEKYKLGLTDAQTSIAEMKKATKWNNGCALDFWEDKKKYMEDKNYPITTRKMTNMDDIIKELDAGQDIEIIESWNNRNSAHATCLIGATKLENGNYSLEVVDDTQQGVEPGGTNNPRSYKYNPKTKEIDEAGFKSVFEYAIVECPKLPKWTYHFKYPYCPGGTLKVYGTHDCVRLDPPLFNGYAKKCTKYQGYVPKKINGKEVNDVIFDFDWDHWCNNEDHIKFVSPKWEGSQEKWVLTSIPSWVEANIDQEFSLPSIGDSIGEIQNIYCIVNLDEYLANQVPPQEEYLIINGVCEDLPGYLIGTTSIVFDPYVGPDVYPFSTTPLEYYVLSYDGEISLSPVANQAPYAPEISGPPSGKPGTSYEFTIVTTDPEEDNVCYNIDWGDGNTEWTGFYASGEEVTVTHTWSSQGTYKIKAKAKDVYGAESEWSDYFEVTMPRYRIINRPFLQFLQNHLNLFPILQILLQRFGLQ